MRRGSLVTPLLLIGLGALLLANTLRPELPVLELIAQFWPFVLIGWGLLRLGEILVWAMRSRPLPVSGISGGEWTLIVFLCLIGSGIHAAHGWTSKWPGSRITMRGIELFGEKFDYNVAGQKQVGKTPHIFIENLRGNARIIGADVTEVKVEGRKTVQAMQQSDADRADQESPLEISVTGDRATVRVVQDRVRDSRRLSADLDVTVPRGASVEARGRFGDFDISNVDGTVEVISDNAGVRLQNVRNNVRMDLNRSDIVRALDVKGTVDLKGSGRDVEFENVEGQVTIDGGYSGELSFRNLSRPLQMNGRQIEVRVERIPGQIRMALGHFTGRNFMGPLRLTARTRDIELNDYTGPVDIRLDRGDIELRPGKTPVGPIEARTGLGDIELAVPAGAGFELTAVSERGDVQNEYGAALKLAERGDGNRRGASLTGSVGKGPSIRLTTERGLIRVRKASAEDLLAEEPPRPPRVPNAPVPPGGFKVEEQ